MYSHCLWGLLAALSSIACLVIGQQSDISITTTITPAINCSSINTTQCSACSAGTYPDSGVESCLCCSSGTCINSTDCLPCTFGFYQPQSGQSSCVPCPAGFYSNTSASVTCQSCLPGFFSNESASVLCTPCGKGSFSAVQNATQCQLCAPGSYCNISNCSICALCPAGEEAVDSGSAECFPCLPGTYRGLEDPRCLSCQNGDFQVNPGSDHCDLCPEDHYCPAPDVDPISCPDDAFCPAGSTAPSYCMETFLQKSGDSCKLAPLTIVLIIICVAVLFLGLVCVVRKHRVAIEGKIVTPFGPKSPLITHQSPAGSAYGMSYEGDPVYAGW
ncbi:proprotein convertase subtilisin/kexin type 6-like [Hyperolius riggenbachi]|uniref:proprotein convertase subtilisin/kexin type 6-like n=1 Tax=Hyperolius riggenbachi TaxID=752182 RepID=UPI0035A28074